MEPTERSMPPERITKVIPTATMALMLVCSAMLSRFETVRKCGVRIHSTTQSDREPDERPELASGNQSRRSPSAARSTRSSVASAASISA